MVGLELLVSVSHSIYWDGGSHNLVIILVYIMLISRVNLFIWLNRWMDWSDAVRAYILEGMVHLAWFRIKEKIAKKVCQIIRQKIGVNVPPSIHDLEVGFKLRFVREWVWWLVKFVWVMERDQFCYDGVSGYCVLHCCYWSFLNVFFSSSFFR